jgi:uncharacterized protein involved in exopolysaccharide biosynthesis
MNFGRWLLGAIIVVALGAMGAVGAYLWSSDREKTYEAGAELLFGQPRPQLAAIGQQQANTLDERQSASLTTLVASVAVTRATAKAMGLPQGVIEREITIEQPRNTNVVRVKATSPDPVRAQRVANEYVRVFRRIRIATDRTRTRQALTALESRLARIRGANRRSLEAAELRQNIYQLAVLQRVGGTAPELIESAAVPRKATGPRTQRDTLFGLLLGAVLGLALASVLVRPSASK